jgi:hypothetical protein
MGARNPTQAIGTTPAPTPLWPATNNEAHLKEDFGFGYLQLLWQTVFIMNT